MGRRVSVDAWGVENRSFVLFSNHHHQQNQFEKKKSYFGSHWW